MQWIRRAAVGALLVAGVIAAACGGGGDDEDDTSTPGQETPATAASGTVTSDATPNSSGTPDPVTTREGQDPDIIDDGATPDATDPSVFSTVGIDALPETPEVDDAADVSGEFTVAYTITELGLPMVGYQFDLSWDEPIVEFVSMDHLENDGLTFCPATVQLAPQRILGACAQPQLISSDYLGPLSLITFRCTGTGDVVLHLRYKEGSFGTKIETVMPDRQTSHSLNTSDATMTCS